MEPDERRDRNTWLKQQKRAANPEEHTRKNREWAFRRKYGITLAQFDQMREAQEYRCAICGGHEDDLPRQNTKRRLDGFQGLGSALVVDHCHDSNRVRKLLCWKCNQGIGCFREDPAVLESALRYIREVCPTEPGLGGISG